MAADSQFERRLQHPGHCLFALKVYFLLECLNDPKWVIIMEFGKRLFWLDLKTLLVCHVAIMTIMQLLTKAPQNLTLLEDILTKSIEINCLISS